MSSLPLKQPQNLINRYDVAALALNVVDESLREMNRRTRPDGYVQDQLSTDLSNSATLQRLIECLQFALAFDDSSSLAKQLGMPQDLDNRKTLGLWIRPEAQNMQFLDDSALFNYVFKQLESLVNDFGRSL
jgi:hypothetical protein